MKQTGYTQLMLTVIALALTAIALRPFAEPIVVQAKANQSQAELTQITTSLRSISRTLQEMKDYGLKVKLTDSEMKVSQAYGDTWRIKRE